MTQRKATISDKIQVVEDHALGIHLIQVQIEAHHTDALQELNSRAARYAVTQIGEWYPERPCTLEFIQDKTVPLEKWVNGGGAGVWYVFMKTWVVYLSTAPMMMEVKN